MGQKWLIGARDIGAVTASLSLSTRAPERTESTSKSCSDIGFLGHRKRTGNRRPLAEFGVNPNIAAVALDDALTQRQPDSHSGTLFLCIKALKDPEGTVGVDVELLWD